MKKRTGVSMKELMLREESYKKDSTSKTLIQHTSIPAIQQNDKPTNQQSRVRLIKKLPIILKTRTWLKN